MRLPPLDALRAFDAAFTHRSFTRAGEALHVTHGAISRQVAQIERHLGMPLFRRVARGLDPTAAGIRFHVVVRRALNDIAQASDLLRAEAGGSAGGVVRVSTMPSFGARWLIPRLGAFRTAHPAVEIEIVADNQIVDLARDGFDLGIRYGKGQWDGAEARLLLSEQLFPVCAPSFLTGVAADHELVRSSPLLHDGERSRWRRWLRAAGLPEELSVTGSVFNDYNLLVEAAANGLGLALGRSALISPELDTGRLVAPFPQEVASEWAYYLVAPAWIDRPAVRTFAEWLLVTAACA